MEKIIDRDERIRRAEELYVRRQLQNEIRKNANIRTNRKRKNPIKRLIVQIVICSVIYSVYYITKNYKEILPQAWIYKISDVLEYDINFQKVYEDFKGNMEVSNIKSEEVLIEEPSKMETDAQYIKDNFSLIKPLEGEVTSKFGLRDSTNPAVTKEHTGIDIASNEGTIIVAAMDGIVELVSTEGDLR